MKSKDRFKIHVSVAFGEPGPIVGIWKIQVWPRSSTHESILKATSSFGRILKPIETRPFQVIQVQILPFM